jgi:hypothetical protein
MFSLRVARIYILFAICITIWPAVAISGSQDTEESGLPLTLKGQVRQPRLGNATVEVEVGEQTFSGTSNPNGNYEIAIDCVPTDATVTIRASGASAQSTIRNARFLGSCGSLVDMSQGTGELTVGPVSVISTAAFALLNWLVEDTPTLEWPITADQLQQVRQTLQFQEIGRLVRVLAPIMNGTVELPAGPDDTLQLVLDRQAFLGAEAAFNGEIEPEDWADARRLIEWTPSTNRSIAGLEQSGLVQIYWPGLGSSPVFGFEFFDASSGVFANRSSFNVNAAFVFREIEDPVIFSDGYAPPQDNVRALRVSGEGGAPLSTVVGFPFIPPHGQVEQLSHWDWVDIRIVDAGEAFNVFSSASQNRQEYPNGELGESISVDEFPTYNTAFNLDTELPSWTGPAAGQSWLMPITVTGQFGEKLFAHDRISFSPGGVAMAELLEETLTWNFEDGVVSIDGPNLDHHEYFLQGGLPGRDQLFQVVASRGTSDMRVGSAEAIVADASPAFDPASVAGRYVGSFALTSPLPTTFFVIQIEADGTGWMGNMADFSDPGPPSGASELIWQIDADDRLVIRRDQSGAFQFRAWTVLATDSNDIYVLEQGPFSFVSDPDFEVPNDPGRLNFYRQISKSK